MMDEKRLATRVKSRIARKKARDERIAVMLERAKTRRIKRAERAKQKGKGLKNDRP
jgi:hypothetical protein